jgi:uracil-DNA glycosylase
MTTEGKDYILNLDGFQDDNIWKNFIENEMKDKYFKVIQKKINLRGGIIYPPSNFVFNAFINTPFDKVKVIIIAQDPYINENQAHGLAFSVKDGTKPPPSLINIFKELENNDVEFKIPNPLHGDLTCWTKQGILLLNACLTVIKGKSNSHSSYGWYTFTDKVIKYLSDNHEGLVFLLWGAFAQKKSELIDDKKHLIIKTSHPSPLGANSTNNPFLGSRCFKLCNNYLLENNKVPINWNLEEKKKSKTIKKKN